MTAAIAGRPPARMQGLGFALLVVLIAINLRAFLTSTSPLLDEIRAETGLGFRGASMLTMLPMLAMGLMSLIGVSLGGRIGARAGVLCGLAAIAVACGGRLFAEDAAWLLASAALAGVGVGLVQALMPGVVKRGYPAHTGMAMGLYSAALMGGGGLGAIGAPWLAHASGDWHAALAIWALPALLAAVIWACSRSDAAATGAAMDSETRNGWRQCLRNPRAWLLACYFGLVNGGYTSLVAWLPQFYAAKGRDAAHSGSMLTWMTVAQLVSALLVPVLARRHRDLRPWLVAMLVLQISGFAALALDAPMAVSAVGVLGFGLGGAFALCMALALDHLPHPEQAGALAAFMQGVGFMVAALAPLATGWMREHAGGFEASWTYLGVVAMLLLPVTWRLDPRSYARAVGGLFTSAGKHAWAAGKNRMSLDL
ncbi:cyanate transporter [Variovorax sp. HW608]|uniref:cyanate transporter n=1 Tax=Variovorax sp. HW608 TaxID=1034889 RepID=UPI001E4661C8|nr:cyanate transporter [Variovorax sp. HW608]